MYKIENCEGIFIMLVTRDRCTVSFLLPFKMSTHCSLREEALEVQDSVVRRESRAHTSKKFEGGSSLLNVSSQNDPSSLGFTWKALLRLTAEAILAAIENSR